MVETQRTPFVLIVEDDRDIAALFRNIMDQAGYRTDIADNGYIALDFIYKNIPDVILLDLSLPGISGVEILNILRSDKRFRNIHTVVITGYSQMADGLQVEPDLVLEKPVSPNQLTNLVNRLWQDDKKLKALPIEQDPFDKSTGLYNRSFFTKRLDGALKNFQKNNDYLFGVLLIKPINGKSPDAGQSLPDDRQFLKETAKSIRSCLRPVDTIVHFEDGNFFLLFENIASEKTLANIGQRIQTVLLTQVGSENSFHISIKVPDKNLVDVNEFLAALVEESGN